MKKLAILFLVATPLLAQMKPQPKPAPGTRAPLSVPGARNNAAQQFVRISIDDAIKLRSSGKAVFIDVRSNEQYSYGHIQGAMSIPRSQLIARFREVTPGKTIITYCACNAEQSAGVAAQDLMAHGVKNVFALKGGWLEWRDRKLPMAVGPR
ncbi:MAG TPA: rhodanese-like domain-containing protein [Thermoanaerobaculia bacterium]|nr:rhodanese-like domain-containing protein [Thermoanaerobaculia bacterium]